MAQLILTVPDESNENVCFILEARFTKLKLTPAGKYFTDIDLPMIYCVYFKLGVVAIPILYVWNFLSVKTLCFEFQIPSWWDLLLGILTS